MGNGRKIFFFILKERERDREEEERKRCRERCEGRARNMCYETKCAREGEEKVFLFFFKRELSLTIFPMIGEISSNFFLSFFLLPPRFSRRALYPAANVINTFVDLSSFLFDMSDRAH